ncbi:MAG: undecaprenyldiphospho-muramoylpentapeptide beta-N-acetylglucosaminyltransferase [Verrucomicrobia bacterium]|nr:MAG: undecaprenyldiphospho-muramoylpentapeptide beta-N-acetylglucosaminyltransferase [Verrucomicrobiota bacterium]
MCTNTILLPRLAIPQTGDTDFQTREYTEPLAHACGSVHAAIACGGTGGHLFPGLAVATELIERGCEVTLLISPKDVDTEATRKIQGMEVVTLPAVGLKRGAELAFMRGFFQSYSAARQHFKKHPPQLALSMGGFTAAPPIIAAKRSGARTFLHESNTIPGRANRWLSWSVDHAFVGFPSASAQLHTQKVTVTGTPVRPQFRPQPPEACRAALGLEPHRPVLLVMGGSQGAKAVNELVCRALPLLAKVTPELQCFHLSGPADVEKMKQAYAEFGLTAQVYPFFAQMELALGAATVAVSRAGASSLAELAAMRVPAVLVPYPAATDDHQVHNARAFESTGAARLLEQKAATPQWLAHLVVEMVHSDSVRQEAQAALLQWHAPAAAEQIAEAMLGKVSDSELRAQEGRPEVQNSRFNVQSLESTAPSDSSGTPATRNGNV